MMVIMSDDYWQLFHRVCRFNFMGCAGSVWDPKIDEAVGKMINRPHKQEQADTVETSAIWLPAPST
jgi:hypothetical protein